MFTSCEVDRIVHRGVPDEDGNLGRFLVGRVLEAEKHPNADRLQLCRVDVGEGEPRQIVCGAWNFGAGATVAVALPGARLPNGLELEQRKVRGELSDGMILAEDEVELGTDHSGIMLLDAALGPGTPLVDVLPLADTVLEIETGYNRPDLTSVYGIAREVSALLDVELAPPPGRDPERVGDEPVDIRIDDLERCPRYIGRLFRDVTVGESPPWLKARLLGAGMRPISNVVDVTNYVMLAFGSPLHAFDHATLAEGRIVVRRAAPGRAHPHARRHGARADDRGARDRRRRAADRRRRDHGRRGDRGLGRDDERAPRGGELRAARRAALRRAAPRALGGADALGEGRRARARRAGRRLRDAAPRRALRRAAGSGRRT